MPRHKALPSTLAVATRLQDQLNDALTDLIQQSERVTRIADKMKQFKVILEEGQQHPTPIKNRHQIGRVCEICNRGIDPRGYPKHVVACRRKHNGLKLTA